MTTRNTDARRALAAYHFPDMTETTVASEAAPPPSAPGPVSGPRATLLILRIVVVLTSLLILVQPFLAGAYLQGQFDALGLHELNANLIAGLALIQVFAALAYWRIGRGVAAPVFASLALLVLLVVQLSFGYSRTMLVHIPLGVAIVGFGGAMIGRVFDKQASLGRPPRSPRAARSGRGPRSARATEASGTTGAAGTTGAVGTGTPS